MDDQTIVFSSYSGGGHEGISGWNITTNTLVASAVFLVNTQGKLTEDYIALTSCKTTCTTYAIQKNANLAKQSGRAAEFPRSFKGIPPPVEAYFQDWLPEQPDTMLVAAKGWAEQAYARLFLWNVRTNQLTALKPGAVYGKYSSAGRWLAWTTYGAEGQFGDTGLCDEKADLVSMSAYGFQRPAQNLPAHRPGSPQVRNGL